MQVVNQHSQQQQRLHKLRLLIAALWIGNIVTVGYMVAPTLFATLYDRVLAGTIAGSMFSVQFWLTLCCGGLLLGLVQGIVPAQRKILRLLIGSILLCAVISHLGLQPMMAAIKAEVGGVLTGAAQQRFGMLHGISQVLYLLQTIAGLILLWRIA